MGTYVKRKKLDVGQKGAPKQAAPPETPEATPAGPVRASRFAGLEDLIPALAAEEDAPVAAQGEGEPSGFRGVVQGLPRSLLQTIGVGGGSKEHQQLPVTALGEGVHLARSGTGFLIILDRDQARQDRLASYQSAWSPSAVYVRQKDGRPFPDENAAKRALQTILG